MLPERRCSPATGGRFVVEVMVPELRRLPPGETFRVFHGSDLWGIDEYDVATQGLVSHHLESSTASSSARRCRFGTCGPRSST